MTLDYDPLSPDHWANPFPIYRELRDTAPVHWGPETETFCLSRYDDVAWALRSPDLFSSASAFDVLMEKRVANIGWRDVPKIVQFLVRARPSLQRLRSGAPDNLITTDPPRHDVMRNVVNRGFTPRRVDALERRMHEVVAGCMQRLRDGESFDVIHDLAIPLPTTVIAEMLGIDPDHYEQFRTWSDAMIAGVSGSGRNDTIGPFLQTMGEMYRYFRPIARERRANPKDDLISVIVDPSQDGALSDTDVTDFITLLLIAGNETTTNLIGNTVRALLSHPDQIARVQADPSLVAAVVEEGVRYESPVQFVLRRATRDTERHGVAIPADSSVTVLLGSANRDERRFPDPDRFDVDRDTKGHMGFGFGVHFCLGASLARLEARVALEALIPELSHFRLKDERIELVDSFLVRGPSKLELVAA
jgi:cytochrome P450